MSASASQRLTIALVGGMLQAGLPVTVMPTTRDIEVQPFEQARSQDRYYFRVRVSEVPTPTQNGMIRP